MNKLFTTTIISLLTASSLAFVTSSSANATNSQTNNLEITAAKTIVTSKPNLESNLTESASEQLVAYNYCYWETYSDGSTYWVCW
jgi:hypothetical protein